MADGAIAVHVIDERTVHALHEPEGVEDSCVFDLNLLPVDVRFVDDVQATEVVFSRRHVTVG